MMYNSHASIFFLILLSAAIPLAHGQVRLFDGLLPVTSPRPITGVSVTGVFCCTAAGTCPGGAPISGAVARLNCNNKAGTSVFLGQNTTGIDGRFNIIAPIFSFDRANTIVLLQCNVTVPLPLSEETVCPILSRTSNSGVINELVQFLGTKATQVHGLVASGCIGTTNCDGHSLLAFPINNY